MSPHKLIKQRKIKEKENKKNTKEKSPHFTFSLYFNHMFRIINDKKKCSQKQKHNKADDVDEIFNNTELSFFVSFNPKRRGLNSKSFQFNSMNRNTQFSISNEK